MARKAAVVALYLVALASFAAVPVVALQPPIAGSALLLALALSLSIAASGEVNAACVAAGALGALAFSALAPHEPSLAGAALVGLAFAERTLRVRGARRRIAHALIAVASGAVALRVSASYAAAAVELRLTSSLVAAALACLPLLVAAEEPLEHLLRVAAGGAAGELRASLEAASSLRRWATAQAPRSRSLRARWSELASLVRARAALEPAAEEAERPAGYRSAPGEGLGRERATARALDAQISRLVEALTAAYGAG
jgi:hypothetical protein